MPFEEILDRAVAMLQRRGRVTYRTLKAQFQLDDDLLDTLKEELLFSYPVADEDGRGLVWRGDAAQEAASPTGQTEQPTSSQKRDLTSYTPQHLTEKILTSRSDG